MQIDVPDDQVGGTWATGLNVGFSGEMFTLNFIVIDDRKPDTARVVQRVRILPSTVQSVLQVMAEQLAQYEEQFGQLPPDGGVISSS